MQLVAGAQAGEDVGQVDGADFDARLLVADVEYAVVLGFVVVDKARGHEVGVSYLANGFKLVAVGVEGYLAVVCIPRCVGSIYYGVGLVKRVVPKNMRVTVGDADVVFIDVHHRGIVYLTQCHAYVLRVAHERYGSVCGTVTALGVHLNGFGEHSVPKGVERQAVVLYRVIGLAVGPCHRGALVKFYLEALHSRTCRHVATHELGTLCLEHVAVRFLSGQGDKLVTARRKVRHMHGIPWVTERSNATHVALFLCFHKVAILVEHVEGDRAYMVVEHVGTLQVVVVLEVDVEAVGAVVKVLLHHVARGYNSGARHHECQHVQIFY